MHTKDKYIRFGIYADLINQYVEYKRSLGFKMEDTDERLNRFDALTVERRETQIGITKELFDLWTGIAPLESPCNKYTPHKHTKRVFGLPATVGV